MRLAVFTYDFGHRKTQDFLTQLWLHDIEVACVVAAPRVALPPSPGSTRIKVRHLPALHPRDIAARMGVPYVVSVHNSDETVRELQARGIEVGVVAGARILSKDVIGAVSRGIVNFHPGLIPEARGLDALKWSVLEGSPPGVTAHLIDHRVDAGRVIERCPVPVHADDTWLDLSLRIDETQVEMLPRVVTAVGETEPGEYAPVQEGVLHRAMDAETEQVALGRFETWKSQWVEG